MGTRVGYSFEGTKQNEMEPNEGSGAVGFFFCSTKLNSLGFMYYLGG